METIPRLWTPQDVGLWLTLPTDRIVRMARKGQIPCIVLPQGEMAFDPSELLAWLAKCRRNGENPCNPS